MLSSSSLGTEKKRYHLFFFLRDITNYIIKLHQVTCLFTSNRTFGTFAQWDPAYSGARWTLPGEQVIPEKTSFSFFTRCRRWHLRVCLLAITSACSRLRRSPVVVCGVEQARSACSTPHTTCFARLCRASPRREKAKALSIRHALKKNLLAAVNHVPTLRAEPARMRG